MPPKSKKKKQPVNPARGFATTSVASKAREAPTETSHASTPTSDDVSKAATPRNEGEFDFR